MKLEFLQKELERISDWIKFSDRKTAFLSVYYAGIIAYVIKNLDLFKFLDKDVFLNLIIVGFFISLFIGLCFLILSIFPRTENNNTEKSLFFFGTVAEMKIVDYLEKMNNISEEKVKNQILEQIYSNSEIADKKMGDIKNSIKSLILIIIFLLLITLK